MALKPFNSLDGFSVSDSPPINVVYGNGDVTASNLVVGNLSNLGPVANITITGGSNGQVLSTDGNGILSFTTINTESNKAAPMPYIISSGQSYIVNENFQGLYSYPITIDGELAVDGVLIELGTPIDATDNQVFFSLNDVPTGNTGFTFDPFSGNLAIPGNVSITSSLIVGNILPPIDSTYSIGSANKRWNNIYLSGNTIILGNSTISSGANGIVLRNQEGGEFVVAGNSAGGTSNITNGNTKINVLASSIIFDINSNANIVVFSSNLANYNCNIQASGIKTDNIFYANGSPYVFANASGSNNQIQFNSNGAFNASANLTFDSSTQTLNINGNVSINNRLNLTTNSAIAINNSTGAKGQILTSDGNGKTYYATTFYYGNAPPDFNTINYGDIFFYIDTETNTQRLYMWVTDGFSDYFYDFLPPNF